MESALQQYSPQYLSDLKEVRAALHEFSPQIAGKKFFITGGTGFLGHWLTDALLLMNARVTVATRSKETALKNTPYWKNLVNWVEYEEGRFPKVDSQFDFIIHAAMDLSHTAEQAVEFARQVFAFTLATKAKTLMLISSGAIHQYSKTKPTDYEESEEIGDVPANAHPYSAGKCLVEKEAQNLAAQNLFQLKIARGYTFIGPHQDLKSHHAASMFLNAAIHGKPIVIEGDGLTERAFLYPSEFAIGALLILFKGKNRMPYNIGADVSSTVLELAKLINCCRTEPPPEVQVLNKNTTSLSQANTYAPSMKKMNTEIGFQQKIDLKEAVKRTAKFYSEVLPHSKIKPATDLK